MERSGWAWLRRLRRCLMAFLLLALPALMPLTGAAPAMADDSCQWALDGECDEPGVGTGACARKTDTTDCWQAYFGTGQNGGQSEAPAVESGTGTSGDAAAEAQAAVCSRIYSSCLATCPMFSGALALTRCQTHCTICYTNCTAGLISTCTAPPVW